MIKNTNPTQLNLHDKKPTKEQKKEKRKISHKLYFGVSAAILLIPLIVGLLSLWILDASNPIHKFAKEEIYPSLISGLVGIFVALYTFYEQKLEDSFLHKKVYPTRVQEWANVNYELNLSYYEAIDLLFIKNYHSSLEDFTVGIPNQNKPEFQEFGTIIKTVNNVKYKVTLIWDKNLYKLNSQIVI